MLVFMILTKVDDLIENAKYLQGFIKFLSVSSVFLFVLPYEACVKKIAATSRTVMF
jgi:hypothetical protein